MSLNTRLAGQVHHWLIAEGDKCHAESDLNSACDRFLERWPRVRPKVLLYVSQMLSAELHVRTHKASQILQCARNRSSHERDHRRGGWLGGVLGRDRAQSTPFQVPEDTVVAS